MKVFCDIETDSLNPSEIYCIVCEDEKGKVYKFIKEECYKEFIDFADEVDTFIGHNFISFDAWAIEKLTGYKISVDRIIDTYVLSRLFNPERRVPQGYSGKKGPHSLDVWGYRLNNYKGDFEDWGKGFSNEMLEYCIQDVHLTRDLYRYLKKEGKEFSHKSVRSEHYVAKYISDMEKNGFYFNEREASLLLSEVTKKYKILEEKIKRYFNIWPKFIKEVEPKYKKDGSLSRVGLSGLGKNWKNVAGPFSLIKWEEFNLNSPSQIVSRLNKIGWKPKERTVGWQDTQKRYKRGEISEKEYEKRNRLAWKISEENLKTIPEDTPKEYRYFAIWKMLYSRASFIRDQCLPNIKGKRIYGRCNSLGTPTCRMTHSHPNFANITSVQYKEGKPVKGIKGKYGYECRSFFGADTEKDYVLLGTDASGLELRTLAHYMNDPGFSKSVVSGSKDEGTDVHTKNQKEAGLPTRDAAKTFIYALIYGAGPQKIGTIISGGAREGNILIKRYFNNMPRLKKLIDRVQTIAKKVGKLKGIDGRVLHVRKQYSALNTLLQGAGAIICKYWLIFIMREVEKLNLDVRLVAAVHDEYQFEVHKKDVEKMKEICKKSMIRTGKYLKLNIPLEAEVSVGKTWAETH